MRILVIIPHYFGPRTTDRPIYGSELEPLSRIAALNETIISLHRNFGDQPEQLSQSNKLDIIVASVPEHNLLAEIGIDEGAYQVEYVSGRPIEIEFHVPRLLAKHLGTYDFYCLLEDDLIIHDPAFFLKLQWFQENFGPQRLLAPVRTEMSSTGSLVKIIIDRDLEQSLLGPFQRPEQKREIGALWNGRMHVFEVPQNPHAGSFFLSNEQLERWVNEPSFNDWDSSWVGPLESAATLSIGKVFDIYKSAASNRFFLELQHYGVRFVSRLAPKGQRYGEAPLIAIAENAIRTLRQQRTSISEDGPLAPILRRWVVQETTNQIEGQLARARDENAHLHQSLADLNGRYQALAEQCETLASQKNHLSKQCELLERQMNSLRDEPTGND